MSEDQFMKLFKYVESFREEMSSKLDEKASQESVDKLTNMIDAFAKKIDDSDTEQAARDYQHERLLEWVRKVSKKTGIPIRDL